MYTPINQWAEDDRPREKFLLKGKSTLSDSELLAILIGSGSRNESAVQLCQRILASSENNLNTLGKMSVDTLDWDTLDPVKTYHSAMTVRDGGIVLMHSIYTQTADAVEKIVPALKKKGFQFVTVSELYRYKGVKMKNGEIYNGIRS